MKPVSEYLTATIYGDPAQCAAMPDKAVASDDQGERLGKDVGAKFGPGSRDKKAKAGQ